MLNTYTHCGSLDENDVVNIASTATLNVCPPDQPQAMLIECLRIGHLGGLGCNNSSPKPFDMSSSVPQQLHPKSHFTFGLLTPASSGLHRALIPFEGVPRPLCYSSKGQKVNWMATALKRQDGVMLLDEAPQAKSEPIWDDAYVVLAAQCKPYADIITDDTSYTTMRNLATETIKGWWHALWTDDGWRETFCSMESSMSNHDRAAVVASTLATLACVLGVLSVYLLVHV